MLYNHNLKNFIQYSSAGFPQKSNVVFYLKLESDFLDSTPNALNASQVGGVSFAAGQGRNGLPAADFNGSTKWLTLADHASLMTAHKATFNVWVKLRANIPSSGKTGLHYFSSPGNTSHYPFSDGTIYDNFGCLVRKTVGAIGVNRANLHMLTITTDEAANEYKFYQNGVAIYQTTAGTWDYRNGALLGRGDTGALLDGFLSHASVWKSVLSAAEILTLYNGGNGMTY